MIRAGGYNPLCGDCARHGCFSLKRRPKIELFADCFPGRISFGAVDGIVEIGGNDDRGFFILVITTAPA